VIYMNTSFGERLKILRNQKKITQEQLAEYLGVGRPTIAGYEAKGKQPSFDILKEIADFFNVSLDYLLGRTDIPNPYLLEDFPFYKVSEDLQTLSPESQKEIQKLIELYKMKDMQQYNSKHNRS